MRVSESSMSTEPSLSSSSLRTSPTVLRGTITPGISAAPLGSGTSTRARRWPSVATPRSTWVPLDGGGMEIDAVQVVARLLGGDGEAGAVDDALEVGRRELEAVRQVALGHGREVGRRQALQGEARAAGANGQAVAVGGALELDLGAVGQLAHDLVERMRRRRRRSGLGGRRLDLLGDGEVHVGGGEAQPPLLRRDQDIGQDGDRVAPLDDALHMGQRLQEGCPFDRQFHGLVAITRGQKAVLDTPFRGP